MRLTFHLPLIIVSGPWVCRNRLQASLSALLAFPMSPDNFQAGPSRSKAPAKVYRSLSDTEESDFEDNPPLRVPFTDAPQLSHTKKTLQTGGRTREPSAKRSKIACGKPTDRHPTCRIIHDITQNEDWKVITHRQARSIELTILDTSRRGAKGTEIIQNQRWPKN